MLTATCYQTHTHTHTYTELYPPETYTHLYCLNVIYIDHSFTLTLQNWSQYRSLEQSYTVITHGLHIHTFEKHTDSHTLERHTQTHTQTHTLKKHTHTHTLSMKVTVQAHSHLLYNVSVTEWSIYVTFQQYDCVCSSEKHTDTHTLERHTQTHTQTHTLKKHTHTHTLSMKVRATYSAM